MLVCSSFKGGQRDQLRRDWYNFKSSKLDKWLSAIGVCLQLIGMEII